MKRGKVITMECDTYREQMSLWLDNRLTQEEIQQVEAHTATCPACRATLDALHHVDRLLVATPMVSPAPGFTARFQARLVARRRRHRTWAGLTVLGLATLALGLGMMVLLATSGLAVWESLSTSGLLTQGIGLLLDLGKAWAALLNLVWLIASALAQGLRHPVFIAYVVATAVLTAAWTQIVTHGVLFKFRVVSSKI
jgi:predicted anti-sigma-YlaC factor YlaD